MSAPPAQIGPYTIDRELGRGGMGVVYLARDTRLDRSVAIKALPAELASDPARLERFEREARTLAQLNHPSVAGIHGVEEAEGRKYLILEYVEGETLAERLDRGPLPVDEALEIATQIAAGVEAAHEAGVIHRDLKPGNVIITPEGKAKVLDFGLARVDEASSTGVMSESPTLTSPAAHSPTMPGVILGTAAYMSPEQARGRRVDKRTDIWSFGVVLYEMLVGASPFLGETVSDSIGAVLHKELDLDRLPPDAPPMLKHALRRCLERDKAKRYRDIGDAALDIELAQSATAERIFAGGAMRPDRPSKARAALLLFAAVVAIAAGAAGQRWLVPSSPAAIAPTQTVRFTKVTDFAGVESSPALSPDGGTIAYVARDPETGARAVYSVRVGGFNVLHLTEGDTSENRAPAFSPDGSMIAFRSDRDGGGLFVMGATGESPRRISDFGHDPAWSPDGTRIAFAEEEVLSPYSRSLQSALWIVPVAGGEPRVFYEGDAVQPAWSPDGSRIAFWSTRDGGERDVYTIAVDGGDPIAITADSATDWNPVWSPDGRWLYFVSDRSGSMNLWRAPIDASSGARAGPLEAITRGAGNELGWISISADGRRIAYSASTTTTNIHRLAIDPDTHEVIADPTQVTRGSAAMSSVDVSPDGRWLATFTGGDENIVLISADGRERRRITDDRHRNRNPLFSPDGRRLLFYSDRSGQYRAWTIHTDGSRLEPVTNEPSGNEVVAIWGPNGDSVFIWNSLEQASYRADMTVPLEQRRWTAFTPPTLESGTTFMPIDWSPDGRRAVGNLMAASGWWGIGLYSPETDEVNRLELGDIGGGRAFWLRRHPALIVTTGSEMFLHKLESGRTTLLYEEADGNYVIDVAVAPDEDALYLLRASVEADLWVVDLDSSPAAD